MLLVLTLAFVTAPLGTSDNLAHSGVLNKDVAARMTLMSSMGRNMGVRGKMLQKKAIIITVLLLSMNTVI